jgi:hypothetical protein
MREGHNSCFTPSAPRVPASGAEGLPDIMSANGRLLDVLPFSEVAAGSKRSPRKPLPIRCSLSLKTATLSTTGDKGRSSLQPSGGSCCLPACDITFKVWGSPSRTATLEGECPMFPGPTADSRSFGLFLSFLFFANDRRFQHARARTSFVPPGTMNAGLTDCPVTLM